MTQPPKDLTRGQQAILGAVICSVALGLHWACGGATAQNLPAFVQCQLDALKVLPEDPNMVTVYDAADIVERVRSCRLSHPDAGR